MLKKFHSFHIVENSPWPIIASIGAITLVLSVLTWINANSPTGMLISLLIVMCTAFCWWRDVSSETVTQGNHSNQVSNGLQIGILLFITSEVLFFLAFFWAFFHSSISPTVEIGQIWPPKNIYPFNPINVPLLNTLLLLSSGVTITWAHHALLESKNSTSVNAMVTTITLGLLFTALQALEYNEAPFSLSDSAFGTTFFIATGFHGLHVIIGSTFLTVSLNRISSTLNSMDHTTGFECAAWYWHFVDVVWLFLYTSMYWWGSYSH